MIDALNIVQGQKELVEASLLDAGVHLEVGRDVTGNSGPESTILLTTTVTGYTLLLSYRWMVTIAGRV